MVPKSFPALLMPHWSPNLMINDGPKHLVVVAVGVSVIS